MPTRVSTASTLTKAQWTPVLYRTGLSDMTWKPALLGFDGGDSQPHTLLSHMALAMPSTVRIQSLSDSVSRRYDLLVQRAQAHYESAQGAFYLSSVLKGSPDSPWQKPRKTLVDSKDLALPQAA
jgi:hypothetical protein